MPRRLFPLVCGVLVWVPGSNLQNIDINLLWLPSRPVSWNSDFASNTRPSFPFSSSLFENSSFPTSLLLYLSSGPASPTSFSHLRIASSFPSSQPLPTLPPASSLSREPEKEKKKKKANQRLSASSFRRLPKKAQEAHRRGPLFSSPSLTLSAASSSGALLISSRHAPRRPTFWI